MSRSFLLSLLSLRYANPEKALLSESAGMRKKVIVGERADKREIVRSIELLIVSEI